LKIGLLTRNRNAWCSTRLREAMVKTGVEPFCFSFDEILTQISLEPRISVRGIDIIDELSAVLVRPIGRGSLEECLYRLDALHRAERNGLLIFNPPSAIEKALDKYYALTLLEENGIPVPRTVVTESPDEALDALDRLGGDVVVKPMFGSRGIGITRVSDREIAERIFRELQYFRHILYIQEFVQHGNRDIRAFVVGDGVVAAMYRSAKGWKTNVSQGASPIPVRLPDEFANLAVKAAQTIGCKIAGVDILETQSGPMICEINSQPGWKGLQRTTELNIASKIVNFVIQSVTERNYPASNKTLPGE